MSSSKIDFLYLDEPSMVKAGVTDMHACVDCMEEVYRLMGQGDYVMGGKNSNSHGVKITFPENSPFPNMPLNGPDRRFMAMVAYIGGKFNIAGEKWYGSNRANLEKGLPRSILMVMLNDPDTGAPIALMSGNLISSVRTGAIPGVGARYLANKESKICALIGAGVISRTCFMSLVDVCTKLETVRIYDILPAAAEKLAKFIKETYPQIKTVEIVNSIQEAVKDADIVNAATSGKVPPRIEGDWLKPGVYISLPASVDMDQDFVLSHTRRVVDNWKMYEAWAEELSYPWFNSLGLIGGLYLDWMHQGKMTVDQIENLGDIISGKIPGREDDEKITLFCMGGQPVYDVAWGKMIYDNAVKMGLGISLNLWDTPYLY